jgi:RND superfamily putative drug exporter
MLERVARFCYRKRWLIVAIWIVALLALNFGAKAAGSAANDRLSPPPSDSQKAQQLLQQTFAAQSGASGEVVFKTAAGVDDPAVKARIEQVLSRISTLGPSVAAIASPYGPRGARQISSDRHIAFAEIDFAFSSDRPPKGVVDKIATAARAANEPGLQVELAGEAFQQQKPPGGTEAIGLVAAIVILLLAFGSLLAMAFPIITALFGIGCGLAVVTLLTHAFSMPTFANQMAAMIGLGVGIDYALFITTRYRQQLHAGSDPETAVVKAVLTSGRAVIFAGVTVVISLLGLLIMGLGFISGLAIGAVAAVLTTMLAAVTLLPAVLGFAGHKIDGALARRLAKRHHRETAAYRWSRLIQRRPWTFVVAGLVALLALAVPTLSLHMGFSDASNNPKSDTTRRAYDLLTEGFGPGYNGRILVTAELPRDPRAMQTVERLRTSMADDPGVASVSSPITDQAGRTAILTVTAKTSPQDARTDALVARLRSHDIPAAVAGSGVKVYVGGQTAVTADLTSYLGGRLPWFIAAVIGLSFLLLMGVFRSVLVPVKAAVMNLLSIGAAYGVVVAVFQWGWGKHLFGLAGGAPIEPFLPMMLFAILFGLSMDYEVFLLSRVREEYVATGDNAVAVADGLAATARVITAAAAIMVCVFGSFVFGDNRVIKLFGLGMATAILVDATLVRMILVPATMELLGDANWWLPRWIDRLIPRISVGEGGELDDPDAELDELAREPVPLER